MLDCIFSIHMLESKKLITDRTVNRLFNISIWPWIGLNFANSWVKYCRILIQNSSRHTRIRVEFRTLIC
jgi:hypothetical protein